MPALAFRHFLMLVPALSSVIEVTGDVTKLWERLEKQIGPQLMELNPDPYKYHSAKPCTSNVGCLAKQRGCNHSQYIGDSEAEQYNQRPICYQPDGPSTDGVCLCPECAHDFHCHNKARCPYSKSGSCNFEHDVPVCKCNTHSNTDAAPMQEGFLSLWESLVCHNVLLKAVFTDVFCS